MSTDFHTAWIDGTTQYRASQMNVPLSELDAAVRLGKATVVDKDLTSPPTPAHGKMYIVGSSATGAWSGEDDNIAIYDSDNTAWYFLDAEEGLKVYVQDENTNYYYDGSNWVKSDSYIIGAYYSGVPGNGVTMVRHTVVFNADFPANLTGSYGKAGVSAAGTVIISLQKNGVEFATATFGGTSEATLAGSATTFATGDVFSIVNAATADSSLADVDFSIKGVK